MQLATRMGRLGTETAFEVLAKAKRLEAQGHDIVHLEIGEPDFDTPAHIREAAKKALDDGYTHYVASPGIPEVRERIAAHQTERQGYDVSPDSIVVTPGAKPIMFFTMMALIEEGDEVIYPDPGFPIYKSMIDFVGGKAVPMRLLEENGFNADIDALRAAVSDKTKLIIVNSPNNPCGSVIPKDELEQIAEIACEVDAVVLTDEVYKDFYYEGEHESISQFPGMRERTIILDGMSKSYAMTGWRMGYGVFPEGLVEPISRLVTNSVSCTTAVVQMASIAAIDGPQEPVHKMVAEFKSRREMLINGLNSIKGISCVTPMGAFYAFPNIKATGLRSGEFADRMLMEGGVALLSGTSFGDFGEGYIRLSFANSQENLQIALDRIENFLADKV
ncbi:MAG: pyridoxal phosphate-dependent aminotransferase [Chloroflexi bacterium]|nr:pyridoxal phosphate-dependent aminotransferase [Chloroflexota bacterium]